MGDHQRRIQGLFIPWATAPTQSSALAFYQPEALPLASQQPLSRFSLPEPPPQTGSASTPPKESKNEPGGIAEKPPWLYILGGSVTMFAGYALTVPATICTGSGGNIECQEVAPFATFGYIGLIGGALLVGYGISKLAK